MMDYQTVLTAISTVGFPIAAYMLMWYDKRTTTKENTDALNEMQKVVASLVTVTGKLNDVLTRFEQEK